jgi:hypothetical protein
MGSNNIRIQVMAYFFTSLIPTYSSERSLLSDM